MDNPMAVIYEGIEQTFNRRIEMEAKETVEQKKLVNIEVHTLDKCESCAFEHTITTKTYKTSSLIKDEFVLINETEEKGIEFPIYKVIGTLKNTLGLNIECPETQTFELKQCPHCDNVKIKAPILNIKKYENKDDVSKYPPIIPKKEYWTEQLHSLSDLIACNPINDDKSIINRMILAIESGADVNADHGFIIKNAITIWDDKLIDAIIKKHLKLT